MAPSSSVEPFFVDRRKWTPEEDALLIKAMSRFRLMQETRWTEVAEVIPGRTAKACRKRWVNGLNDRLKKGSWTSDEDARLREGVALLNNDWARIADHVGQRSGDQCSKRWREVLDPTINKSNWSPEEDEKLVELFNKHGSCWQEISTHFDNRRALQCRNRCCKLLGLHSHQRIKKQTIPDVQSTSVSLPHMPNQHASSPMIVSHMADMELPMDTHEQSPTANPAMLSKPLDTPLTTGYMPQMINYNGMNFHSNQVNMDYLNADEVHTSHFVDAWIKVQGFSSTERKDPPASLNLTEMDPPMGSLVSSPSFSTYSPTADPTQYLNSGSGASSLDASPSTPFSVPTAVHAKSTSTGMAHPSFLPGATTLDVSDGFFLSSPSLAIPPLNMDESFKIPANQPQMTGTLPLPSALPEYDMWSAGNYVL